jgi:hypothetical protein
MKRPTETSPAPQLNTAPASPRPAVLRITDPNLAQLLVQQSTISWLRFFSAEPVSLQAVSKASGLPIQAFYRKTQRLIDRGVLEISQTRSRGGRAIKYYRLAAERLFIPHQILPFEELFLQTNQHFEKQLAASVVSSWLDGITGNDFGTLIMSRAMHKLAVLIAESPERVWQLGSQHQPAVFSLWHHLNLSFEDAKQLQAEMAALFGRYDGKRKAGAQHYLMRLVLAPVDEP